MDERWAPCSRARWPACAARELLHPQSKGCALWPASHHLPTLPPVPSLRVPRPAGWGILRSAEFGGALRWDEGPQRAAMADILRVHDWNYVKRIQVGAGALGYVHWVICIGFRMAGILRVRDRSCVSRLS